MRGVHTTITIAAAGAVILTARVPSLAFVVVVLAGQKPCFYVGETRETEK